ncbi:MAG TPA: tetratricopeptide repeat protein [bacterium]|nr:tetratricopeptide repeat protein [bacterium]
MRTMNTARATLGRWDFHEADRLSRQLLDLAAKDGAGQALAKAHQFRASYCFFAGDYACARDEMQTFGDLSGSKELGLLDRSKKLAEVWQNAGESRSDHFIVRYLPGKDSVLAAPALETLERAYLALTGDFDIEPGDPVLVEIYPSFDAFQAATNLSPEALENSGTIAVCKYRRLMINTPRNLSRGYSYRDTLCHEFVHFLVYQKYGDGVPIWLHEGLAKFEEYRWRQEGGSRLSPGMKSLLASAIRQNEFITFDQMHPSFAYLKTPRQGQLAFAEVSTVVEYFVKTGGWKLVFALCDELRHNSDYRSAIRKVTGKPFDRFWADWVAFARGLGFKEIKGMEITALEIKKGDQGEDDDDEQVEESDLAQGDEWKYARLGDLLRDRGHFREASFEYGRALEIAPYSLRILNKAGRCYYLDQDYELALTPLYRAVELYPGYSTTYINLGRALYEMGRKQEAAEMLGKALDINPFNPIPYGYLIKIYEGKKDDSRVKRLEDDYRIITG